jgi:hypothetical protein
MREEWAVRPNPRLNNDYKKGAALHGSSFDQFTSFL